MAEETEAIYIAATDGEMFYGLRLAVTPAVKAKVVSRDAMDSIFEGTGTQIKGQDLTPTTVAAKVKTQIRYASVAKINPQFITDLLYSGRQGEVYNFVTEAAVRTWRDLECLPVPAPQKLSSKETPTYATESTQKVKPFRNLKGH